MPKQIVIIGSGIAGLSAAIAARKQDPQADVKVLSQESTPPFYRLRLCGLIGKEVSFESLYIHPLSWYSENRISLLLDQTVLSIDRKANVISAIQDAISFDALVIASGSTPVMPPFIGKELPGIFSLWNMKDIAAINESLKTCRHAVVIGGGLLGLDTAYNIRQLDIPTTLIEGMTRLLPKQLDEAGSAIFTKKVESLGISVVTGQSVQEFKGGGHVEELVLADGRVLKADLVVVSVGVRPNLALCESGGIRTDRYIPVNDRMQVQINPDEKADDLFIPEKKENTPALPSGQTAIPGYPVFSKNIYAAGDVASYNSEWFGQWTVAMLQGQIAGANAAGGDEHYRTENSPYILSTMGTRIVVSGNVADAQEPGQQRQEQQEPHEEAFMESVQHTGSATYSYIKLVFKNKILTGGILIGDYFSKYTNLQMLIKNGATKETVLLSDLFPR